MFKRTPILQQLEDNETDIYFTAIDSSLDYSVSKFEKETSSAPKKYPLSCTELEFDLKSDDEQKEGSVASSDRFDKLEKNVSIRITHLKKSFQSFWFCLDLFALYLLLDGIQLVS